jgi:opacity protein-like surface antigen
MRKFVLQVMVLGTLVALPNVVAAQSTTDHTFAPNGYVLGRSGVTFGTATAPLVGAEIGGSIGSIVSVYAGFDWHRDISPTYLGDAMDLLSDFTGIDVNARMPTFTLTGGARVQAPRGAARPYGIGGFGYGRMNGTIEVEGDDVTDMATELGLIDRDDLQANKLLFEVGGGVVVPMGRAFLDAGYRFRKFLEIEDVNMSGLYIGGGISF